MYINNKIISRTCGTCTHNYFFYLTIVTWQIYISEFYYSLFAIKCLMLEVYGKNKSNKEENERGSA